MVDSQTEADSKPVVLVADDDEMQRFLIKGALECAGFVVHLAENGAAALEACAALRPDLVLLDVIMPVMDGYEACAALRNRPDGEQLPIVLVTGQDDIDSVARAYDVGATDFIAKPLNWTLLRHRIRYVYRAGKTLKELRASETRLAEAQNIAHLGSWEWTVGDTQIECSTTVFAIFGLAEGNNTCPLDVLLDCIHPDDRHAIEIEIGRVGASEKDLATECRLRLDDHSERVIALHAKAAEPTPDGQVTVKGTVQDVTERRYAEARLHHLAHHDSLTGLPNRPLFQDRLGQALALSRREGVDAAVFCIDINRFKDINDSFGHAAGDRLLQDIALRLQNEVRGVDTVARLGGDAFAVIQVGVIQPSGAEQLSYRLLKALDEPFTIEGEDIVVSPSIGVAVGPHDAGDPEQLLIKADMALHRAKSEGLVGCHFFEAGMDVAFRARKSIEQNLRDALEKDWFELHYQPQIALGDDAIVGVEALLRLRHPENGLVMPNDFIPIAEETGLILPMGSWVIRAACFQAMAWQKAGLPPIRVAVNLSPGQLLQSGFAGTVTSILNESGLDPRLLEVEITEKVLIRETATVLNVLERLRNLGVQIAMDDFGTGYSSLSYLLRFPFDRIKIDRSFVKDMSENQDAAAIVGAVIALGHRLNMSATAEGVETLGQLNCLKNENCDEVQGYYFARPVPAPALAEMLAQGVTVLS